MSGIKELRNKLERIISDYCYKVICLSFDEVDELDKQASVIKDIPYYEALIERAAQADPNHQALLCYFLENIRIINTIMLKQERLTDSEKANWVSTFTDLLLALQWQYNNDTTAQKVFAISEEISFMLSGFIATESRGEITYVGIERSIRAHLAEELKLLEATPEFLNRYLQEIVESQQQIIELSLQSAEIQRLKESVAALVKKIEAMPSTAVHSQTHETPVVKGCLKPPISEMEKLVIEKSKYQAAFFAQARELELLARENAQLKKGENGSQPTVAGASGIAKALGMF